MTQLKDTDDRKEEKREGKKGNKRRMQTYEATVECKTTITGTDYEDAYDALKSWLNGNEKDWKIIDFKRLDEDAW